MLFLQKGSIFPLKKAQKNAKIYKISTLYCDMIFKNSTGENLLSNLANFNKVLYIFKFLSKYSLLSLRRWYNHIQSDRKEE